MLGYCIGIRSDYVIRQFTGVGGVIAETKKQDGGLIDPVCFSSSPKARKSL